MTFQEAIDQGLAHTDWPDGVWPVDVVVYAVHPDIGNMHGVFNLPDWRAAWSDSRQKGYYLLAYDGSGDLTQSPWKREQ